MITFASIAFVAKRAVWFVIDNWKLVLPIIALLFVVLFVYRACNKPAKLDEAAILKAQQAIAQEDRKEMLEILAKSDVQEQGLDDTIKGAEAATEAAKQSYSGLSNDELAAELEKLVQRSKE